MAEPAAPVEKDPYDFVDPDTVSAAAGRAVAEAPAVAPAAPAAPAHALRSLRLAAEYGIPDAEVRQLTPDQLDERVHAVTLWLVGQQRQAADARAVREATARPLPAAPAPEPDEFEGIDPALHDPGLLALLRRQRDELKALRAGHEGLAGAVSRREQVSQDDMLDGGFEALGPAYEAVLGTAPMGELMAADKPAAARRIAVFKAAGIDFAKDTPRVVVRKLKDAANLIYGPLLKAAAPAEAPAPPSLYGGGAATPPAAEPARPPRPQRADGTFMSNAEVAELERWQAAALPRPTHRAGAGEPRGKDAAVSALANRMKEIHGVNGQSGDVETGDFLS